MILPGVGTAREAMRKLEGFDLQTCLTALGVPVLGICLGMQLLFSTSEEGKVPLLGLIDAPVIRFREEPNKTIPHMGWNTVKQTRQSALMQDIADEEYFYFVHSYFAPLGNWTIGQTDYMSDSITACLQHNNIFGCQFHPERSGIAGSQIFKNFMRL